MCACGRLLLQLRGNLPLETEQGRGLCVNRQHVLTMGALARLTQVGKFLLMYLICLFFFFLNLSSTVLGTSPLMSVRDDAHPLSFVLCVTPALSQTLC